jgi:tetratricopeptide (TPR) repeat protein
MAKRKKKSPRIAASFGFGAKDLKGELQRVEKYLAKEEWNSAIKILLPLAEQYPQAQRVWELLNYASYEIEDFALYQRASEGWAQVQPENANVAYSLASAYLANAHPLMALQAFRKALDLDPEHQFAEDAKATIQDLEKLADKLLSEIGLDDQEGWEIALLHEQGQAGMEEGNYAAAREAENEVLARRPQFQSARNNLSLISWLEGNMEDAIKTAQSVLDQEPDNVHALSNLVHFLAIQGNETAARPYAERLQASQAEASDSWTKKVEGLSYLRDDAAVVEVFEQAQAIGALEALEDASQLSAMFFHLVGVALARLGRRDEAITQWETALDIYGTYPLAQENLTDIRHTIGLRHGAWPFFWQQWLLPGVAEDFLQVLNATFGTKRTEQKLDKNLQKYLDNHPDFLRKVPLLLERGGPQAQDLILLMTEQLRRPELLAAIKDFALSQNGTDELRNRAAMVAAQENLLPKKMTLWVGGEWREILLMGYEFHSDPIYKHSKKVVNLLAESISLLRQMNKESAQEAEALLRQALEIEPNSPDLLNNLGRAIDLQGHRTEAEAILEDIVERFPDYLIARTAKAKNLALEGDLEAAEALLQPLLERERFHILEFSAFADAYITLSVAKKQWDGARTWLDMWKRVNPEDPRLSYWEKQFINRIWIPK